MVDCFVILVKVLSANFFPLLNLFVKFESKKLLLLHHLPLLYLSIYIFNELIILKKYSSYYSKMSGVLKKIVQSANAPAAIGPYRFVSTPQLAYQQQCFVVRQYGPAKLCTSAANWALCQRRVISNRQPVVNRQSVRKQSRHSKTLARYWRQLGAVFTMVCFSKIIVRWILLSCENYDPSRRHGPFSGGQRGLRQVLQWEARFSGACLLSGFAKRMKLKNKFIFKVSALPKGGLVEIESIAVLP